MNKLTKIASLMEINYKLAEEKPDNLAWVVTLDHALNSALKEFATNTQYTKEYGEQELTAHIKFGDPQSTIQIGPSELDMLDKFTRNSFRQDVENVVDAVIYKFNHYGNIYFGGYNLTIF